MIVILHTKNAFLFQGVGTEYIKFFHLLNEKQIEMLKHYCSIVNDVIKLDLWGYLTDKNSYALSFHRYCDTFTDSILIYVIDYIIYKTYIQSGITPSILLGYSMGLITALACGEALTFEDGLKVQLYVYKYSRYSVRDEEAMAVTIGINCSEVEKLIIESNFCNEVEIASENNEHCIIISGSKNGVEKIMDLAINEGALQVKRVNSKYAFHSKFAKNGIEKFERNMEKIPVFHSNLPVISCFTQNILQNPQELKQELIRNMSSRMYWKSSIEKANEMNIYNFYEVSLNDSVTKFSKMINQNNKFITYKKFLKCDF